MKIVIEEVRPGAWQVNPVPETRAEAEERPDPLKIAEVLLKVGTDLVKQVRLSGTGEVQRKAEGGLALPPSGAAGLLTPEMLARGEVPPLPPLPPPPKG